MARILIVEDNPANLKLATLLLTSVGHNVLLAADAETGLALALSDQPELILMDIQLPGMDGLTATSILKADQATAGIPVVALTAMAMKSDEEKSRLAGCDGYIAKPLNFRELYIVIDELLGRPAAAPTGSGGLVTVAPPEADSLQPTSAGIDERWADAFADDASVLDIGILQYRVGNDRSVVLDFLETFQETTVVIAQALVTACVAGDAGSAGAQAHKLMSSARAVGAVELGNLCAAMEAAGRSNRIVSLAVLRDPFETELARVNAAINRVRESVRSSPKSSTGDQQRAPIETGSQ